jgi:hypothetical protein
MIVMAGNVMAKTKAVLLRLKKFSFERGSEGTPTEINPGPDPS